MKETIIYTSKYLFSCFCTIIVFLVFTPSSSDAIILSKIKKIYFKQNKNHDKITISATKRTKYKTFILHDPQRLVIDITDAKIPQGQRIKRVSGEFVKRIRAANHKKNKARIVLDLKNKTAPEFSISQHFLNNTGLITIDIFLEGTDLQKNIPPVVKKKAPEYETAPTIKQTPEKEPQDTAIATSIPKEKTDPSSKLVFVFDENVPDDLFSSSPEESTQSNFSLSGEMKTRATKDRKESSHIENNTSFRNKALLELKYKENLYLSVLSDYIYFGEEEQSNDYSVDLYNCMWKYSGAGFGFSIGKQIIRWGKVDQLSPVDSLNPEDMREFITYDYEDRKIPVWMADMKFYLKPFDIELVYIPFFKESRFDHFKTDWSLFPHIKENAQISNMPDHIKGYIKSLEIKQKFPEDENEYGIRLSRSFGNVDLGLTWHRTYSDTPYILNSPFKNPETAGAGLNPPDNKITLEYKRADIYGMEFETTFADFGIRGEAILKDSEPFIKKDMISVDKSTLIFILGIDYTFARDFYLNINFLHQHIFDFQSEILFPKENRFSLFGELNFTTFNSFVEFVLGYYISFNDDSKYLSPEIKCTYLKNSEISLGIDIFTGEDDSETGRFRENNQYYLKFNYFF